MSRGERGVGGAWWCSLYDIGTNSICKKEEIGGNWERGKKRLRRVRNQSFLQGGVGMMGLAEIMVFDLVFCFYSTCYTKCTTLLCEKRA